MRPETWRMSRPFLSSPHRQLGSRRCHSYVFSLLFHLFSFTFLAIEILSLNTCSHFTLIFHCHSATDNLDTHPFPQSTTSIMAQGATLFRLLNIIVGMPRKKIVFGSCNGRPRLALTSCHLIHSICCKQPCCWSSEVSSSLSRSDHGTLAFSASLSCKLTEAVDLQRQSLQPARARFSLI